MEKERLAREAEEKQKAEKVEKVKEQFADANGQWEKDKSDMQKLAQQEKKQAAEVPAQPKDGKPVQEKAKAADGAAKGVPKQQ